MNKAARLSDKKIVDGKAERPGELLDFHVEYQDFFRRHEYRRAVSESALRHEIDTTEPWRPPYTVTRVLSWDELKKVEVGQ